MTTTTKTPTTAFELSITVEGTTHDLSDLTLGEAELLEDAFDRPLAEIDLSRAKAVRYLYFIAKRREDPKVTLEDLEDITVAALTGTDAAGAAKRPTKAARKSG